MFRRLYIRRQYSLRLTHGYSNYLTRGVPFDTYMFFGVGKYLVSIYSKGEYRP